MAEGRKSLFPEHRLSRRYAVMLHVESEDDPIEVAAAIAVALNYQHVGGICVAPAETFSWEDPVPSKGVIRD